jgi:hypothetical protein
MPSLEVRDWVNQVIHSTESGAIQWRPANPTTYTWDTRSPKAARVILQRIDRMENYRTQTGAVGQRKVFNYLLQAFDLSAQQATPVLTINGSEDAEANPQLENLYTIISNTTIRENIDFLKSILPAEPGTGGNPKR